jgi:hypothetical protein
MLSTGQPEFSFINVGLRPIIYFISGPRACVYGLGSASVSMSEYEFLCRKLAENP